MMLASRSTAGTGVHVLGRVTCRCLPRSTLVRTGTLVATLPYSLQAASRAVATMVSADKKAVLVS